MSRQDPSSPVQFRRLRRFCRWTCRLVKVTVLLAIIVGIVYVIWTNHRGDKAARAMINQLAARGIPGESRPWVPDVDNGARFYLAAMKLLVLPKDLESKLPVVGWAEWPQFGEGFTEAQADVLREAAGRNTEALDLARAAQSMPRFSFEMNPVANQSRTLTELGQCRNLAKWLELHSLHSQAQSNGQGAADDEGGDLVRPLVGVDRLGVGEECERADRAFHGNVAHGPAYSAPRTFCRAAPSVTGRPQVGPMHT